MAKSITLKLKGKEIYILTPNRKAIKQIKKIPPKAKQIYIKTKSGGFQLKKLK